MNHREASQLLQRRASLSPEQARELDAHVAACHDCESWHAAWELFTDPRVSAGEHLDSKELSIFALAASELDPAARNRCARHLAACPSCSEEVDLVRAAVSAASNTLIKFPGRGDGRLRPAAPKRAWMAVAAALALLIGGLVVGNQLRIADRIVADESANNGMIFLEATTIESGSVLVLEGETVALGNGFSVASGGGLTVVGPTSP